MNTSHIIQPVTDNMLYNDFMFLKMKFENMVPILDDFDLSLKSGYNRSIEEGKELERFSSLLQKQLLEINVENDLKQNLDVSDEKICQSGNYPPPIMKPINSLIDLPTINQIINNHFKMYLKEELNENVCLFNTLCKLDPLLIRNDGLSVVRISSIKTDEIVCDPPNHNLPGISVKSVPSDSTKYSPYIPICLMDLSKYIIHNDEELENVWKWKETIDFHLSRKDGINVHDIDEDQYLTSYYKRVYLYIDGDAFC